MRRQGQWGWDYGGIRAQRGTTAVTVVEIRQGHGRGVSTVATVGVFVIMGTPTGKWQTNSVIFWSGISRDSVCLSSQTHSLLHAKVAKLLFYWNPVNSIIIMSYFIRNGDGDDDKFISTGLGGINFKMMKMKEV